MAHAFYLGVDVDESEAESTPSATLTILQKEQEDSEVDATYRLDHIRHQADAGSAETLADHIQGLVAERPYIGRTNIVVNGAKAFGKALAEALSDRGLDPVVARLTPGQGAVAGETNEIGVHLGTSDAVRTLAELYRDHRIGFDDFTTEAASELARAVQRASEVLDEADGDQETPEAAGSVLEQFNDAGSHLTSAALAAWVASERSFDPTERLKETPQTERPGDEELNP